MEGDNDQRAREAGVRVTSSFLRSHLITSMKRAIKKPNSKTRRSVWKEKTYSLASPCLEKRLCQPVGICKNIGIGAGRAKMRFSFEGKGPLPSVPSRSTPCNVT